VVSGAGIYRKISLVVSNPVHVGHWATFVTTPKISDAAATVNVATKIENKSDKDAAAKVEVVLIKLNSESSKSVANATIEKSIPAGGSSDVSVPLEVANPKRWDVNDPQLYSVQVVVRVDGKVVDVENTTFGIRDCKFTADDGFHLNGRRVQLNGVCLHHDQGPLGGVFLPRAMERQLEIMRDMGVNAIRTSHNPPAPELLELCDKMGFVVWDECFDKWNDTSDRLRDESSPDQFKPSLEEYGEKQIRSLVMRDRNHPSVVVWSIGNEIGNQPGDKAGRSPERVKFMRDFVLKYDDTRQVGMADCIPETAFTQILDALDLCGWNYGRRYANYRDKYPNKPIIYSESASAFSTRGFYELPLVKARNDFSEQLQVDSYDYNSARWSDISDVEFDLMERDKFVAGEFVWTGFDYLGEPTPFDRQATSSYFGIVDLCGFPKDRFYLYRSHWRPDTNTIHILPHWNWPDRVGQNVPVFVYTNGDSAELFLNGKSLGRREKLPEFKPIENIALGKTATASSTGMRRDQPESPEHANDGNSGTRWTAASGAKNEWWQVDLGSVQPIAEVIVGIDRDHQPGDYQYRIDISDDGENWKKVAAVETWLEGWGSQMVKGIGADARYLRITFTDLKKDARACLREVTIYPKPYYAITDKYRLRWLEVPYEPGELKAIAYKNGQKIGEAVMRTTGDPAAIGLTPDRSQLTASGDDLCYVTVEARDAKGGLCPLADNLVKFEVEGPAEIAGVGNGNPMSQEPVVADHRKLFYGKAMLVLRTKAGQGGKVKITATADGLPPATATVECHP
jgi:beta-galactosidase